MPNAIYAVYFVYVVCIYTVRTADGKVPSSIIVLKKHLILHLILIYSL